MSDEGDLDRVSPVDLESKLQIKAVGGLADVGGLQGQDLASSSSAFVDNFLDESERNEIFLEWLVCSTETSSFINLRGDRLDLDSKRTTMYY